MTAHRTKHTTVASGGHKRPHRPRYQTDTGQPPGSPSHVKDVDPAGAKQYYIFTGSWTDGVNSLVHSFAVLAGDGGATVTGGYAKWGTVDRPRRTGLSVLQGYDPLTMTVPIIFDVVTDDYGDRVNGTPNRSASGLEDACQKLNWMAGRGMLDNTIRVPGSGDSPLVEIATDDGTGHQTPLVPKDWQITQPFWVVSDIGWDTNPLRNQDGFRVQQKATVTLFEYVPATSAASEDSPSIRAKGKQQLAGKYVYVTTIAGDTIPKVAWRAAHTHDFQDWQTIIKVNVSDHKLKVGTSVKTHLKAGIKLRIPQSIVKHLSQG